MMAWLWFAVVQLVSLIAMVAGWLILIVPCALQAWHDVPSQFDPTRQVDAWSWPINAVYGNPEDGVSGQHALVWDDSGHKVAYMPGSNPVWRAYCWSAWRNSTDNLKYVFAWAGGPFVKADYTIFGKTRTFRAGWQVENGIKVPVISLG
jgi:hypothetical protein